MVRLYSDIERATLQLVIAQAAINEEKLEVLHQKFKAEYENPALDEDTIKLLRERSIEDTIELINSKLHPLHFQITRIRSQRLNEYYYSYVNTLSDLPSKAFTTHSPKEIEIVKNMINIIFTDNEEVEKYLVGAKEALSLCKDQGLNASQGEQVLNKLVHEGWFDFSRTGKYTLSLKSLAEIKRSLIEKYGLKTFENDDGFINQCIGCHEIVTLGIRCPHDLCNARFHKECQLNYAKAKGSKCPNINCDVNWESDKGLPVGEGALKQRAVN